MTKKLEIWEKIACFAKNHRLLTAVLIVAFIGMSKIAFDSIIDCGGVKSLDEGNTVFERKIAPFYWVEHEGSFSLCLNAAKMYKKELFASRSGDGFKGNGDDWASLADVFLEEKMPELKETIDFDPETGMFCAYSSDPDSLAKFALAFKDACEDDALIQDLFSRAKTDHIFDEESMKKAYEELLKKMSIE